MALKFDPYSEWLETDGLGGFASGTVSGIRTRRYHALLLVAATPPGRRFVLVNGFDAWVQTPRGTYPITSQSYTPDKIFPDGTKRIESFEFDPWPSWTFRLEDGTRGVQEIFMQKGVPGVVLSWKLVKESPGTFLWFRPLFSGRDYHNLHHENPAFRFDAEIRGGSVIWHPYEGLPAVVAGSNGEYKHYPDWFRSFLYKEEQARGLDFTEDLATPGVFRWDLSKGPAVLILGTDEAIPAYFSQGLKHFMGLREVEAERRRRFPSRLHRSADDYIVHRGHGKTIVAGYPWFSDWGRDTFISLRGLCLATGRLEEARAILLEWAGTVSEGMIPNRFPDQGSSPEFNSVDASLWYVIAVSGFLGFARARSFEVPPRESEILQEAVKKILTGYIQGTRFGIRLDEDGLLSAGQPGVQLTWMDAKVGDWVVTPRIGKPVEVQALWLNALAYGMSSSKAWQDLFQKGVRAFRQRFWNKDRECLYDVVDMDHLKGRVDGSLRPNQIFAVGGLPLCLLAPRQARHVVDVVESELWTPMGLRSLAPGEPGYTPRYQGGVRERDAAYHQGTAWPWLIGPFVEAWVRVRGSTPEAKTKAQARFLKPLLNHLNEAGLGHISEIADADPPHAPRGCPFQAWSLGELIRLSEIVFK